MPHALPVGPLLELILHELRTPANVAGGSLAQAAESPADAAPALERTARALTQIDAILADLALLVRLGGAPGDEPPPPRVPAADLLRAMAAESPRLRLEGPAPEAWIRGDRDRLLRALVSLARAALREAPADVEVRVGARVDAGDRTLCLAIGEESPRPDAPSFGAEFSGGLGLTLVVARAIVESHGGVVWSTGRAPRAGAIGVALPLDVSAAAAPSR